KKKSLLILLLNRRRRRPFAPPLGPPQPITTNLAGRVVGRELADIVPAPLAIGAVHALVVAPRGAVVHAAGPGQREDVDAAAAGAEPAAALLQAHLQRGAPPAERVPHRHGPLVELLERVLERLHAVEDLPLQL